MKTIIRITGQISGNFTLNNAIARNSFASDHGKGMFNSFWFKFDTKKEAKKAIRKAYKDLISDEPEMKGRLSGIRKSRDNEQINYDASQAIIEVE